MCSCYRLSCTPRPLRPRGPLPQPAPAPALLPGSASGGRPAPGGGPPAALPPRARQRRLRGARPPETPSHSAREAAAAAAALGAPGRGSPGGSGPPHQPPAAPGRPPPSWRGRGSPRSPSCGASRLRGSRALPSPISPGYRAGRWPAPFETTGEGRPRPPSVVGRHGAWAGSSPQGLPQAG